LQIKYIAKSPPDLFGRKYRLNFFSALNQNLKLFSATKPQRHKRTLILKRYQKEKKVADTAYTVY
jgi:hypothetical protein